MRLPRLRGLLPAPLKRPLRRMRDALGSRRRQRRLDSCVRELRRQTRAGSVEPRLLGRLRAAWGNDSFSIDESFVCEVAARALTGSGPFLDCGTGLSTLVAGVIAEERGARVWSVEQDAEWYEQVRGTLERLQVGSVELRHTPLQRYGDYVWFDLSGLRLPPAFSHTFCDGPAVWRAQWPEPLHANWRAGLVPILQQRGIDFGEILLDDAEDERCGRLCQVWNECGITTRVVPTPTGFFVLARRP